MRGDISVAEYLLTRLKEVGIDHLFGIPGDFVLGMFDQALVNGLQPVGTGNELNAAFAADGYARIRGIGAFITTFGVGELCAISGVAGAFAERVPIVMIVSSPNRVRALPDVGEPSLSGTDMIPQDLLEKITVASTVLQSGLSAPDDIDRILFACLLHRRPVYIGVPSEVVTMRCQRPATFYPPTAIPLNPEALREAVLEGAAILDKSSKSIVIAGAELIRFSLQKEFACFLEQSGLPYVTRIPGKGVLSELHPQFMGLYEGTRSRPDVLNLIATADCILHLGASMSEFPPGDPSTELADTTTIRASLASVKIRHHLFEHVRLQDFILGLTQALPHRHSTTLGTPYIANTCHKHTSEVFQMDAPRPLTFERFFERISHFVEKNSIVIAEAGKSLFGAAEMQLPDGAIFIGQSFYGSIGYTVGATLGAAMAAQDRRVLLFVGDGSFQATCQDLATMIQYHLKPILFLLNDSVFAFERAIGDRPHNDIQSWRFHKLVDVVGGGLGIDVRTEGDLELALQEAVKAETVVFIQVHPGGPDDSETLRRVSGSMAGAFRDTG